MKAVVFHDIGDIRLEDVRTGAIEPRRILTKVEPLVSAIDAYEAFDRSSPGWMKVELLPARAAE